MSSILHNQASINEEIMGFTHPYKSGISPRKKGPGMMEDIEDSLFETNNAQFDFSSGNMFGAPAVNSLAGINLDFNWDN